MPIYPFVRARKAIIRLLIEPRGYHSRGFWGTRDALFAVFAVPGAAGAIVVGSWWWFAFCLVFGAFEAREAYLKHKAGNWPGGLKGHS